MRKGQLLHRARIITKAKETNNNDVKIFAIRTLERLSHSLEPQDKRLTLTAIIGIVEGLDK